MKLRVLICALGPAAAGFSAAQPAVPAAAPPSPCASEAEALGSLESQDGNDCTVAHADGRTIVGEPLAAAQWSFTPSGHPADPAVVRRGADGAVAAEIGTQCAAPKPACARRVEESEAFDERIRQSVGARLRTPPPAPR